jgi:hypothetical protein
MRTRSAHQSETGELKMNRIDLTPEEREQIETARKPADEFHTIASFWVLAILLLVIVAVAPALEAATHHLT